MPGRTPSEAIDAFMAPLQEALACIGSGHLSLSPKARGRIGEASSWTLNNGDPMRVGRRATLKAKMFFEVVRQDNAPAAERFRAHTLAYLYGISIDDTDAVRAHYHPAGDSPVAFPHWHFPSAAVADSGVFIANAHVPSPRVSFEFMVRWLLASGEAEPMYDDWDDRLHRTEQLFDVHKTWN